MIENKIQKIEIRVTQDEKKLIRQKAEKAGMSVSEYLRKISFTVEIRERISHNSIVVLSNIGNNLNQLTRHANTTGEVRSEIKFIVEKIKEVLLK